MNKTDAAKKKATWLAYCLHIGWDKKDLDGLSETWDRYYDEEGNRKPIPSSSSVEGGEGFQSRVDKWLQKCFGLEISRDKQERNHRFIEESLELVQACGATESECQQLVSYVFNREVGEKNQEVGGVMVTLAALCLAQEISMNEAAETELARIWTKVEKIREKQANKPKHSPLPAATRDINILKWLWDNEYQHAYKDEPSFYKIDKDAEKGNKLKYYTIPELLAIFKQSDPSKPGKDDYWPDLEKKIREKFEIGDRGRTFKIPIDELMEFLKQNQKGV